ncbi:DNA polymerase III subunit delta [Xylocopilactobacillus apicola]|uniref:DNA polymerase III subunit delta n=1 Tax=Xylocopilactobacillus apicola TaxID=2932184 RepID=A0AAU9DA63_9LACO|nr:DNA polymerase III subunit delta [Xylocopilactobacillus apicola]BDR59270.1 DNA polymerase III subunit delta [Xylocopilactobacillus apicola]
MDLNSYIKEIKKVPAVIYLATGDETALFNDLRRKTKQVANLQQASFTVLDLAEDSAENFLVELDNSSLFASKRYLYVEHFFSAFKKQFNAKQAKFLESRLKGSLAGVTLIFSGQGETIDRRIGINKLITRNASQVDLSKLKPNEVRAKLVQYFKRNPEVKLERPVIEEILTRTNFDYTALRAEIPKLELFLTTTTELTVKDVKELISANPDDNVFGLIGALSSKSLTTIMPLYRELLDFYGQPYVLNGALISNFQLLLQVKILSDAAYDQGLIQKKLGIHPYRIKLALQNSQRFSMRQLMRLNHLLLEMDQKIKTSTVNYDELFSDLILELKIGR